MEIFISWSKRTSQLVAEALRDWIPQVIQQTQPSISSKDIHAGTRWFEEISTRLEKINIGILCITPSNLTEPWLLFEAGALSKTLDQSKVIPLLIGLSPSDITPPLSQFNAVKTDKEEIRKLIETINAQMGNSALSDKILYNAFEKNWPDLEMLIEQALQENEEKKTIQRRSTEQILEELITLTRSIAHQFSDSIVLRSPLYSDDNPQHWPYMIDTVRHKIAYDHPAKTYFSPPKRWSMDKRNRALLKGASDVIESAKRIGIENGVTLSKFTWDNHTFLLDTSSHYLRIYFGERLFDVPFADDEIIDFAYGMNTDDVNMKLAETVRILMS